MHWSKSLRNVIVFVGAITLPLLPIIAVSAPLSTPSPSPRISTDYLTIGWVGDMVPADEAYNAQVFGGVAELLTKPDLMIANLEGTFADDIRPSKCLYILTMCHAFRGSANFADEIQKSGIDFVSLVNNHSYDYGEAGLTDTERELKRVGIPYISPTKQTTQVTIKGKKIGILGLSSTAPGVTIADYTFITENVAALKKKSDIVIVIFHGGAEGRTKTSVPQMTEYVGTENRGDVALVARTAIDAGADLILGSGPHVLRKIETYKGKPIAYSLGNFVGGNKRLTTTGTLGISAIFTAFIADSRPSAYSIDSIILSRQGIPSMDPLEQGRAMIEDLSSR